ncbi:unnamed protein product [Rotaria socialis]
MISRPPTAQRRDSATVHPFPNPSMVSIVLGAQWGDEGKGKLVDLLASEADIVCRCQGGNNAGHTVLTNGIEYDFHMLPSGFHLDNCVNIIGNGCVVNLPELVEEIQKNESRGVKDWSKRLLISDRAHLVFDFHKQTDGLIELGRGKSSLGTTKKGIGPTYSSKATRNGIRMIDLVGDFSIFAEKLRSLYSYYKLTFPDLEGDIEKTIEQFKEFAEYFRQMTIDTISYLNDAIVNGSKIILVEGANATMLDIDFEHAEIEKFKQKGKYDRHTTDRRYAEGDLVWVAIPTKQIGENSIAGKLQPHYQGPCRLIKQLTPSTFTVLRINDNVQLGATNTDRLKPYFEPIINKRNTTVTENDQTTNERQRTTTNINDESMDDDLNLQNVK